MSVEKLKEKITETLKEIKYPGFSRDIVSFGVIKDIAIDEKARSASIALTFTTKNEEIKKEIASLIAAKFKDSKLIGSVTTHEVADEGHAHGGQAKKPGYTVEADPTLLPEVTYKIAVSSGKGGVGKSTVTANLAAALTSLGKTVGILDVDVYGPTIPIMFGTTEAPRVDEATKKINPIIAHGIKLMSVGLMVPGNQPIIWRASLVNSAILQLLGDVAWGKLDYMLFDLPPGTGDAQLTIAQKLKLTGGVIVTTPQSVSTSDVERALIMFDKMNVRNLGIVENMSYFACPHCGERTDIFSAGGGRALATKMNVPLLGEIPIDPAVMHSGEEGKPIVLSHPENLQSKAFIEIAKNLDAELSR